MDLETVKKRFQGIENNIVYSGKPACEGVIFGPRSRYKITPINTRFGVITYFVHDAETLEEDGSPCLIRQSYSIQEAMIDLD